MSLVLAPGTVVRGAATEFARPDRFPAGRARGAAFSGEAHATVVGVDDIWRAVLVGVGGDETDGLVEDGQQVSVKARQPGARDPVRPAGRRYSGPVQRFIGVYVADAGQYRLVMSNGLNCGPAAGDPFHEHLAGERGIDGVRAEPDGQLVLGIHQNGAGPTPDVVKFDAPPSLSVNV